MLAVYLCERCGYCWETKSLDLPDPKSVRQVQVPLLEQVAPAPSAA